jgi:hypothetical protein
MNEAGGSMTFAKRLAAFLKGSEKQWMDEDYDTYMTAGGGTGFNEYTYVNIVELEKQIDAFIAEFKEKV